MFAFKISIIIVLGVCYPFSFWLLFICLFVRLVNNCVGLLNYRYFCNFVLSCSILCLFAVINCSLSVYYRWESTDDPGQKFAYNIPSFLVGIIAFMLFLTLSSFWCYHCRLAMSGTTTREDLKFRKSSKEIEVVQGSKWMNLVRTWCRPLPPPLVHFFFFKRFILSIDF